MFVCLLIDARLIYAKPSSSDTCEFPKGLLHRFVNEIKVYPYLFLDLYFFFSNEDGLVEHPEFFRKLFKVRRSYKIILFLLTPVFTYEIRDHSDKRVLDRKLKWNLKRLSRKSCSPTASKTFYESP